MYTIEGLPKHFSKIEFSIGKGKSFEKSKVKGKVYTRQQKIYSIDVFYN